MTACLSSRCTSHLVSKSRELKQQVWTFTAKEEALALITSHAMHATQTSGSPSSKICLRSCPNTHTFIPHFQSPYTHDHGLTIAFPLRKVVQPNEATYHLALLCSPSASLCIARASIFRLHPSACGLTTSSSSSYAPSVLPSATTPCAGHPVQKPGLLVLLLSK